ncbi:MAG: hypothetical protein ABIH50_07985 [bacterium]
MTSITPTQPIFGITIDQIDASFPSQNKPRVVKRPAGDLMIFITPETTAAELSISLSQLGVTLLSSKQIEEIAVQNGNNTFEGNEIYALNTRLRSILSKDRSFILAETKMDRGGLWEADETLKRDRDFVLAVLKLSISPWIEFMAIDQSLLKNADFLKAVFEQDFSLYPSLPAETKKMFRGRYEKIVNDLKRLDINPLRFRTIEHVQEIVHNRENLEELDPRPLAVIIYPKTDKSGFFKYNQIERIIESGYRVVYFEAANEEDVYISLKAATAVKQADLLILGGHGTQSAIAFGASDPAKTEMGNEIHYIDLSDVEEMEKLELSKYLSPTSMISLESCSTGEGKENTANAANMIKRIFPQSQVFAPTAPFGLAKYSYDEQGMVIGISYYTPKRRFDPELYWIK